MNEHMPYLLLVDDDDDDRHFFLASLEKQYADVKVMEATDGREATGFLACCPTFLLPGLIVLDYDMPFLNGADMLLHLAPVQSLAAIPKVVWSHSNRHYRRCKALGAREYFVKPESTREMDAIITKMIRIMLAHDAR